MVKYEAIILLNKLLDGTSTLAEAKLLSEWILNNPDDNEVGELVSKSLDRHKLVSVMPDDMSQRIIAALFKEKNIEIPTSQTYPQKAKYATLKRYGWVAAAAVLIPFFVINYFFDSKSNQTRSGSTVSNKKPNTDVIAPGSNKAILQLGDGKTISLDDAANGNIAEQGGTEITKTDSGRLAYSPKKNTNTIVYNTLTTPNGGKYELRLPDGTDVWLNAASSIKFPTTFSGTVRQVEITGEAYFEVAHNKSMPFQVAIKSASGSDEGVVEVFGTHFNINAYGDVEKVKTTLLEGSVLIRKGTASSMLKTGQQLQILTTGNFRLINDADVDEAVAWKNGRFDFKGAELKVIMSQIMRWYDVEVTYQGVIPERDFTANISRGTELKDVLKVLEQSNIHFKILNRKLIVMP